MEEKIEFYFKKTKDLSIEEKKLINELYNVTFENFIEKKRSIDEFMFKYESNLLGFSFHGMIKINDKIIGSYNVIPGKFLHFKEERYFGQSVDTAIDKNFKGNIYNLRKLSQGVYDMMLKDNINFVYGLPNRSFYKVKKKILNWNDIGALNYYVYPVSLKNFLGKLKILNSAILFCFGLYNFFKFKYKKANGFQIEKIGGNDFINLRYDATYNIRKEKNYTVVYKKVSKEKYNNAKFVYIIDIFPFSKNFLEDSVKKISVEEKNVDLIIYLDIADLNVKNMFKVPNFFFKAKANISGKILNKEIISETIFNKYNWQMNLSSFDVK